MISMRSMWMGLWALALAGGLAFGVGAAQAQTCGGQPSGNTVCASPSGGGMGFAAFRPLISADLPTWTTTLTINGASFVMEGNISAAAWTTNGIRVKTASAVYTDTSSSGTVATAYTDFHGGATIAASSATTYTNYYGAYYVAPVSGTNVTFTHGYAIGGDSANFTALFVGGNAVPSNPVTLAQGGLGASQAAATANQVPVYPGSGGAAVPTSISPWFNSTLGSTNCMIPTQTSQSGWVGMQWLYNVECYNILAGNSAATNSTNLTSLLSTIAAAGGGGLFFPNVPYSFNTSFAITKPMTISCGFRADPTVNGNIRQSASAPIFLIRSSHVTITNCSTNGGTSPIEIGDDSLVVTNGANVTSGNTTLTCGGCAFTAGDQFKQLSIQGQGFLTSIASVTDATHVVLANAPAFTNAAITFAYGFTYVEDVIQNVALYNFTAGGISIIEGQQWHIDHAFVLGTDPINLQNVVWSDEGDGEISQSTIIASVAGTHNVINSTSGGGLRVNNNKILGEAAISNCIQIDWSGVASVGPFISNNSIEGGCSNGINIDTSASGPTLDSGIISANEIGVSGTGIIAAPTTAHTNYAITGNVVRTVTNNTCMSLTNMTGVNVVGNMCDNTDGSGSSTAYGIGSTSSGYVNVGFTTEPITLNNLSSSLIIDNQNGMNFSALPTAARVGSRIYCFDCTTAATCAGSGNGTVASRINTGSPKWGCSP